MPAKKKLTKAEKEKLKKEEQEKKELEEEEERARLAEEEKKKKKEEKLLAVEKQKLQNEERKHRKLEMVELMEMLQANRSTLQAKDDQRRKDAKWARYMRCDGSPDPTNQGEINTYINLKMENHDRDDAESVLKDSQLDLALIAELDFLLSDTPLEDLPDVNRQQYRETVGELQHVIQRKLDAATLQVLCDASKLQDPETSNLQYLLNNDNIALCVWGNLSKNPRIKSFEFPEAGFSFDIPRVLTLTGCAMRYLHTKFDHYSLYSKAFYPRSKKKEPEVVEEPEPSPEEEEKKEEVEEGDEKKEGEEEPENPDKEDTMGSQHKSKDLLLALSGGHQAEEKEEEAKVEEEEEVIEEDFEDPKTPEPTEWEDFDEEDDVIDLRAYNVVGGIFCFDLLNLPPQPKNCKDWVITQLVEPPNIEFLDYVADPPVASGQEKTKDKEDKRDEKPLINVTVNLPGDVMFLEEPQVARWDAAKQYWRTDGFSNFVFDEDNRVFKFSLSQFGTLCLLQDAHINMPFQSWELRPHKTNAAVLTIIAAIVELEIEIKDGLCSLSQPADKPELAHLRNQWVTPKKLIESMRTAGLNVFPQVDSSKYVTVQNKNPIVAERMYDQMGQVASAIAFSWSKWNSEVDGTSVVLQGTESLQDEPLLEEDWSLFMSNKRRFIKLKMTEFDEQFSDEMEDDIQIDFDIMAADPKTAFNHQGDVSTRFKRMSFRSNLSHYAREFMSEAAKERIQESSMEFVDCVQQLLKATQVLTYA